MAQDFFKPRKEWKLINGDFTTDIPYGHCCFWKHSGYLTKGMLNTHKCIEKNCVHFRKNTEHPFFVRKEQIKVLKKAKKNGNSTYEFNGKTYLVTKEI